MSYDAPPPPPPGGGYGQQPPYGAAPLGTNKKAMWSMILGILGLLCCGLLGIPALILSNQAKNEIASTGQGGAGMAKAGLILGIIACAWFVIGIILYATGVLTFNASSS